MKIPGSTQKKDFNFNFDAGCLVIEKIGPLLVSSQGWLC